MNSINDLPAAGNWYPPAEAPARHNVDLRRELPHVGGAPPAGEPPTFATPPDYDVDLRRLFARVYRRRWWLAAAVLATVSLAVIYILLATKTYSADGILLVEKPGQLPSASLNQLTPTGDLSEPPVSSEVAILDSSLILASVARDLGLEVEVRPDLSLLQRLMRRGRGVQALPTVQLFEVPRPLEDEPFRLHWINAQQYELRDELDARLAVGTVGEPLQVPTDDGDIRLLVAAYRGRAGEGYELFHHSMGSVVTGMRDAMKITEDPPKSGVITLSYRDTDPRLAAAVVNAVQKAFVQLKMRWRSQEAQDTLDYVRQQLPIVEKQVAEAQQRLNTYQSERGTVDVQRETELVLGQAVELENKRMTLAGERASTLLRYTPEHPAVASLDQQIRSIDAQLAEINRQAGQLPARQQQIYSLMRDLDVNTELYKALQTSAQELRIAVAGSVGSVRIVDEAYPPKKPSSPKKAILLIAAVAAGLFLGMLAIVVHEVGWGGVDSPMELRRKTGLPVFATVLHSRRQSRRSRSRLRRLRASNAFLLVRGDGPAVTAGDGTLESLRELAAVFQRWLHPRDGLACPAIFSSLAPGAGKTFVCANTAALLATAGARTLLIDADPRGSAARQYLALDGRFSLGDYLAGDCTADELLQRTAEPGLTAIAGGLPLDSRLLSGREFAELLADLCQRFDFVLVNAPTLANASALVAARLGAALFMVVAAGRDRVETVQNGLLRFGQQGVAVDGLVLNWASR